MKKNGEAPIHFRIIKDRKISYISSSIFIPIEHWDEKNNKIKSKHTNSARLNSFLTNKYAELQDQVYEHITVSKSVTNKQLKEKIYGKNPSSFLEFADKANLQYELEGKIGTFDKNKSILMKLKNYLNGRDITFQEITPEFLLKYEQYLRTVHLNKTNTVHKDYKFIRKLFNDALRLDIIDHSNNPFTKYKVKTEKTQRQYLTEEELSRIELMDINLSHKMNMHRDMFVFASYAGGLRVSDVIQLKWKHFNGSNIDFTIKKTGMQLSIKLPNKALDIINKYKQEGSTPNTYIFPALKSDIESLSPREIDGAISRATALINKNLKYIAAKNNITKNLSFHISRHTFATRALFKGISIDKVSKLMGHSAIKETQIYAKIINTELDKAMDVFNE